ncbi:MAG: PilZ domain-containing protein, partial [Desulfobacterales bacterium]
EERRRLERFDLQLPADIECLAPIKYKFRVFTRNISAGGAYFDTTVSFPESTRFKVNLFVTIKDTVDMPPTQVKIDVRGCVLRSERTKMALRFDEDYRVLPVSVFGNGIRYELILGHPVTLRRRMADEQSSNQ